MDAALAEAEQNGVEIIEEVVVDGLVPVDDGVEIHITRNKSHDVIPSKAAIIASGPWASSLIPSWAPYLKVTRQLQAWINVGDNDTFSSSNMPTWYMSTPYSNLPLYGIPCDPASENPRWIKFGIHVRDIPMNPSYSSPHLVSFERRELMDAAHVCLTCEPTFELAKPCLYTMSPDAHFLVGTPREFHKKVVAAAGLSGHGFKMVPALGEMLTDMVLGEDVAKWKAEFLSPSRFGIQS
jgi:sarcosine oxidase